MRRRIRAKRGGESEAMTRRRRGGMTLRSEGKMKSRGKRPGRGGINKNSDLNITSHDKATQEQHSNNQRAQRRRNDHASAAQ
jgi:hypothetical protein